MGRVKTIGGANQKTSRLVLGPLLILIIGAITSGYLWDNINKREESQVLELVTTKSFSLLSNLEQGMDSRFRALDRMARRWGSAGRTPYGQWLQDAAYYYNDQPGYQSIQWADADGKISWVYPILGNDKNIGKVIHDDPENLVAMRIAKQRRLAANTVAQEKDGVSIIHVFSPLFMDEGFDGYIVGIFATDTLIESLIPADYLDGLNFQIFQGKTKVFENAVDDVKPTVNLPKQETMLFIGDHTWKIQAWPTQNLISSSQTTAPTAALVGSIVVSVLVALLLYLSMLARDRLYAIRDKERRMELVVDTVVDAIITIGPEGLIRTFNPAAEQLFGYKRSEILGKNVSILMPEPFKNQHNSYLDHYRRTGKAQIIGIGREVVAQRRDGSVFPADLSIGELKTEAEHLFTGVIRDVTERHEVDRLQREFVSVVSHELRTPITSINGSLKLMQGGIVGELPPQALEMVNIALANADRLLRLINDILDLEKIESGRVSMQREACNLRELIAHTVTENEGYADKFKITLRFLESPREPAIISADPGRLSQVLSNLLSNAIKHSSPGSTVDIALTAQEKNYRITVTDYGRGIPVEFQKRVFEKFQQADSSTTREVQGSGLGLTIAKSIVEEHGGSIGFHSIPGKRTLFWVDLLFDR